MLLIIVGVVTFVGGVFVGDYNHLTIDKAIAALKAAEANAYATLAKINNHKAS